ncbi:hypothetical protein ACF3NG_06860 [Aerococcaceae bacterium WGS1372]
MKENLKTMFMLIGITATACAMVFLVFHALNEYNAVPDILSNFRRDPIYQVNIVSRETPQIVYQTKVGDDVEPHRYEVWYNPKTQNYMERIVD